MADPLLDPYKSGRTTRRAAGTGASSGSTQFIPSRERKAFIRNLKKKQGQLGKPPKKKPSGTIFGRALKAVLPKDLEVAGGQIASSLIHTIPGTYEMGKESWKDVFRLLHGKPPRGTELKYVRDYAKQVKEDVRHPRRNLGYLLMDIATFAPAGAGAVGRVREAGQIRKTGYKTVARKKRGTPPPKVEETPPPKGGHTFSDEEIGRIAQQNTAAGKAAHRAYRKRKSEISSVRVGIDMNFDPTIVVGERVLGPKHKGQTRFGIEPMTGAGREIQLRLMRFDSENPAGVPINKDFYPGSAEGLAKAKRDLQERTWEEIQDMPSTFDDPNLFKSGRREARAQQVTTMPARVTGGQPARSAAEISEGHTAKPGEFERFQASTERARALKAGEATDRIAELQGAVLSGKMTAEEARAAATSEGLVYGKAERQAARTAKFQGRPPASTIRTGGRIEGRALLQQLVTAVKRGEMTPQEANQIAKQFELGVGSRSITGQARITRAVPEDLRPSAPPVEPKRTVLPTPLTLPTTAEVLTKRLSAADKQKLIEAREQINALGKMRERTRAAKASKQLDEFIVSERVTVPHKKFEGKTTTKTVQHSFRATDAQDAMRQAREAGIKVEGVASPLQVTKGGKTEKISAAEYQKLSKEEKAAAKKAASAEARAKAEARIAPIVAKEEVESSERLAMLAEQKRIADELGEEDLSRLGDDFAEEAAGEDLPSFTLSKEGKKQIGSEAAAAAKGEVPPASPEPVPDRRPERGGVMGGPVGGTHPGHTGISKEDLRVDPEIWELMTPAERTDITRRMNPRKERPARAEPRAKREKARGGGLTPRELGMNKKVFDELEKIEPGLMSEVGLDQATRGALESKARAAKQEGLNTQKAAQRAFVEQFGDKMGNSLWKLWLEVTTPKGGGAQRGPAMVPSAAGSRKVGTTTKQFVPPEQRGAEIRAALFGPKRHESYRIWAKTADTEGELRPFEIPLPQTAIWKQLRKLQLQLLQWIEYSSDPKARRLKKSKLKYVVSAGDLKRTLRKSYREDLRIQDAYAASIADVNARTQMIESEALKIANGEEIAVPTKRDVFGIRGGIRSEWDAQASDARRAKKSKHSIGAYVDAANKVAVMGALYAKVPFGYLLPNLIGQFLILGGEHAFNPIAVHRSLKMASDLRKASPDDLKIVKGQMFEGITSSLTNQTSASLKIDRAHGVTSKFFSKLLDGWMRDAVFMHEAWTQGYRSTAQLHDLLHEPRHYGDLVDITKRANKNAVDYGRMSKVERDYVRRAIFFYPWFKGATMYTGRFIKEHPVQTQIGMGLGRLGEEDVRRDLGPVPSYMEGSFKVGERNVPGLGKMPTVINPTAVQVTGTLGETLNVARGAIYGKPRESEGLTSYFTPALSAATAAIFRTDPFTGKTYPAEMSMADIAFQELTQTVAPYKLLAEDLPKIRKREKGELSAEDTLFPYSTKERLGRYGLGVYPYAVNVRESRSRALAEARTLADKRQGKLLLIQDYHQRYLDAAKKVGFLKPGATELPKPVATAFMKWGEREANIAAYKDAAGKSKLSAIEALEADLGLLVRKKQMTNAAALSILQQLSQVPDSAVQGAHRRIREAYFGTTVISRYKRAINGRLQVSGERPLTVP